MRTTEVSRRAFMRFLSLTFAAPAIFPALGRSQPRTANEKLNLVLIGLGARGAKIAANELAGENYLAFCDVDDASAAPTYQRFPDVPRYRDYRRMFDRLGNSIDGVVIATPDHMHYPIAAAALSLGKHVYLEKPLAHTIWEARQLAKLATERNVATQMGNTGHSGEGPRLLKEWLDAGILGEVRELHSWTDRPGAWWPQGRNAPDHSEFVPVVPRTLDWDLWLGVAATRPYDPAYLPFVWRGFWDFGTGALGDMGCHLLDGGFWALALDQPTHIEAVSANGNEISGPTASIIRYRFPARGGRAEVVWTWYDGGLKPVPPPEFESGRQLPRQGTFIIGSKATALAGPNYQTLRIVPETRMQELAPELPPKTLPRVEGGHFADWLRACRGGMVAGSHFSYAARLTEACLLGNIAIRSGRDIHWDAAAMKVSNMPDANRYVTKGYRPGFGV